MDKIDVPRANQGYEGYPWGRDRKRSARLTQKTAPARRYSCYYGPQSTMHCRTACPYASNKSAVASRHGKSEFDVNLPEYSQTARKIHGAARVRKPLATVLCMAGFAATLSGALFVGSLMGWLPGSGRTVLEQTRQGAEITKPAAAKPMRPRRTLRVNVQPELPAAIVLQRC
jgi:hypothetical protein